MTFLPFTKHWYFLKSIVVVCVPHLAQMYLYSVIASSLPTCILGKAMPCTIVAPCFGWMSPIFLFARLTAETCTLISLAFCDNVLIAMCAPKLSNVRLIVLVSAPVLFPTSRRTELLINTFQSELCFAIWAYHVFTSDLILSSSPPISLAPQFPQYLKCSCIISTPHMLQWHVALLLGGGNTILPCFFCKFANPG